MTSWRRTTFLVTATLTTLAACSTDTVVSSNRDLNVRATSLPSTPGQYVIIGRGETLPANLEAEVAAAGGTIVQSIVEIGVAVAKSNDASFRGKASKITGVESVTPDLVMEWTEPLRTEDMTAEESALVGEEVASSADNDPLYRYQWAPPAIQAPETWNAGLRGTGVRVAILDGGLFSAHPDLAANVDVAASRSFVAGFNFNQDIGTFWHGTHVAGIVAAVDNTIGVVGIAPKATLIGVKVLHGSSGSFTAVINGIMYAATPLASGGGGADVINMSLGATITDAKNKEDKADI
ncbi:MAG: S8 family serine peptidase, partial [Gemmatimonadaceae bacterium]